jgi:hypothetical protein
MQFLDSKPQQSAPQSAPQPQHKPAQQDNPFGSDFDDDIPF